MLSARDLAVLDVIFTSKGEYSINQFQPKLDKDMDDSLEEEFKNRELVGVERAEGGDLQEALEMFTSITVDNPKYPSAFNNRAQIYRLMARDQEALKDLNHCISLNPPNTILRQAYTQRSVIYKQMDNLKASDEDLLKAAQCGSVEAKCLVKEKNPFAKMCNQVISGLMLQHTK
jgi:tetratricopeptide (TPR) repeat protein